MDCKFFRYVGVLVMIAATCSGCAMCDNSLDNAFGAYGGRWQRTDQFHGRVASVIDPAGINVVGSQSIASGEGEQFDDGRASVLRPEASDGSDETSRDQRQAETIPELQPGEPSVGAPASEPAGQSMDTPVPAEDAMKQDVDATTDEAPPEGQEPVDLPDFFKELGLDSDPSAGVDSVEDLLPSTDAANQLPPLRTGTDQ